MPRKTIDIETLRKAVNTALATDTHNKREHRLGAAQTLEYALHATDNYRGFRYLTRDEVPAGAVPGIERNPHGTTEFPDDSRRFYY
jgi:hypothetical protein